MHTCRGQPPQNPPSLCSALGGPPVFHTRGSHRLLARPPAGRKSLTYFNRDPRATLQEVTFELPEVRRIFFGSFHKVPEVPRTPAVHVPPKFWVDPPRASARHHAPAPADC